MAEIHPSLDTYPVRTVPLTRPLVWLAQGWEDLFKHPAASLAYGGLVTLLGALILLFSRHPFYIAAAWVGFLLAGPILTAGLCELSRRREEGSVADFESSLAPLSHNRSALVGVAEALALLALLWFVLSGAIYFGMGGEVTPELTSSVWSDVMRHLSAEQLVLYGVVGLALCAAVFALSVVTVPMIVDRHVDASTAMRMSLRVAVRDAPAMIVWAMAIAVLVLFGFGTGLIGMVLVFPLLGHATWRAYRELVE
ncbi:MAG: DUF2189 domain-containing protein [Halioglobus sp.]|nr:DUF2189 domain-containing protein [Halioglobus sp.]